MHASIWKFSGDPDGIVMVDTCPSRPAFEAFAGGEGFRALRERHGLPEPDRLDDFPVHVAFVGGERVQP